MRGIVVNVDILGCRPYDVEPVFENFSWVLCDLLGLQGDVGFRAVMGVL